MIKKNRVQLTDFINIVGKELIDSTDFTDFCHYRVGQSVFVKPPNAKCNTRWQPGKITAIHSALKVDVDGVPRHVKDIRIQNVDSDLRHSMFVEDSKTQPISEDESESDEDGDTQPMENDSENENGNSEESQQAATNEETVRRYPVRNRQQSEFYGF